jgi:hypothetical protein
LLYSPVKTSHDEIIDLTLSSSEDEHGFGSESELQDLLDRPLIPNTKPRLKRLIKGSRVPDAFSGLSLQDNCADDDLHDELGQDSRSEDGQDFAEGNKTPRKPASKLLLSYISFDSEEKETESRPLASHPKHIAPPRSHSPPHKGAKLLSLQPETHPASSPTKKGKSTRVSKKALQVAEQARREAYAQQLFHELNVSVFNGGLPESTALKWSNRLLTTAGRARWKKFVELLCVAFSMLMFGRSRDGLQTTEIELATKVLDSDGKQARQHMLTDRLNYTVPDRIRNTLSHEMCVIKLQFHALCLLLTQ